MARENWSTMARLAVVKLPRRRNAGRSSVSAAQSEAISGLDQSFVCCAYRGGYGHKAGLWGKGSISRCTEQREGVLLFDDGDLMVRESAQANLLRETHGKEAEVLPLKRQAAGSTCGYLGGVGRVLDMRLRLW